MSVHVLVGRGLLSSMAVALLACAPSSPATPDALCGLGTSPVADWAIADPGPFTMRIPPGFEEADVQAVDSRAGIFRDASTGAEISYDYGWYSNDLAPDPDRLVERARCEVDIGGRAATVVIGELRPGTEQQRAFIAAATWRNLETDGQPVHLTIWSSTPDSTQLDQLRGVLSSVRF